MYSIPVTIEVKEQSYAIRNQGDYRMVLDCFSILEDVELTKQERIMACLIVFYQDFDSIEQILSCEDVEELTVSMFQFFNCNESSKNSNGLNRKLMDWESDSQLICSAVNKVAGKEIRTEPYMHWWTFLGYYMAIGESLLSTIISVRDKILSGKKLEKHEKEFRLRNPQYFNWNSKTVEDKEADELMHKLWNRGK